MENLVRIARDWKHVFHQTTIKQQNIQAGNFQCNQLYTISLQIHKHEGFFQSKCESFPTQNFAVYVIQNHQFIILPMTFLSNLSNIWLVNISMYTNIHTVLMRKWPHGRQHSWYTCKNINGRYVFSHIQLHDIDSTRAWHWQYKSRHKSALRNVEKL